MTAGRHAGAGDRAAWDLIPWVVAGTASEAEGRVVERHVAACPDCAAELAFQRAVRSAVVATVAAAPDDAEPALAQMMARIDASENLPVTAPQRSPRGTAQAGSRWLALAGAAVIVVQAVAIAVLAGATGPRNPAADYATLSRPDTSRATLRLVPAASLSLRELQALLERFDLEVVDASADGAMFGLAPRHPGRARGADVLAALRATPGVLLAEPIVGPAAASVSVRP